jgi:serine protease Do
MQHRLSHKLGLCALISLFAVGGCTRKPTAPNPASGTATPASAQAASAPKPLTVLPSPALARAGGSVEIADVVERVLPSVVSVWSTRVSHTPAGFSGPFGFPQPPRELKQQGLGSGVVVAPGVVITNNHVVEGAEELKVTTADKHEVTATVVGTDPKSDLAVLRVKGDTSGLKPIELGDSSRLRLGDVVLAVGNPFGVGQTVTMGIVSAKGRANMGIVDYEDFIQTDAAINPGNSGGALVDMEGHLVGINTAILSRSGGSVGIGFAIPSNMARPIVDSLITSGKVVRGFLGVAIQDVDQDLAAAMKLPAVAGVLVSNVNHGTPAERAGLRRGDVIVQLDGKKVESAAQFRNAVAADGTGSTVALGVVRNGKDLDVKAVLAEMPSDDGPSSAHGAPHGEALDGLSLGDLTPELRHRYHLPGSVADGAVVTDVQRGSPAAFVGLHPGDVVLEVDRHKVKNAASFKELYQKSGSRTLMLLWRNGQTMFIVLKR